MNRSELASRLPALTIGDEQRLGRQLARAGGAEDLARVATAIERAERRVARRAEIVPAVRYPAELPIVDRRADILEAISGHQVVVIAGETGSGKTTQIPKMCLELGRGVRGLIGHTQPRRLAARTVAERIAEELGTTVGKVVGYTVRFTDHVSDATLIKLMTDGILLAELHRDRLLRAYDTIIIDEAHERSLNIDFVLGYLKDLLPRRPDLKVIITSATIDTARFAAHFGNAPIVEVSGRNFPVEVRYRPLDEESDQIQAISEAVAELSGEGDGDILVFLSGEREIRDTAEFLSRTFEGSGVSVLPLYARLSGPEQHRVFTAHTGRRIVLATNVAETSLTVPGIRYVIDPGTARVSRYNRRTKVQRLPIEPISQASANQRAGRCGRVAPGICVRLYAEEDFAGRPEFTEPEILRTNLASVILRMAALDLGDIVAFPFVEPPDFRAVRDGVALLEELAAVQTPADASRLRLTAIGRQLARLPVDPRHGRMLLEAGREGSLRELLIIAAGLSIQDPRERPVDQRDAAHASHARFADPDSDFLSIVRLWDYLQERQAELSSNQFRRLCRAEFLNFLRVREWQDLHGQLRRAVEDLGLTVHETPAIADAVHRAALAGLLSHIGIRDPERPEYRGARDSRFQIAAGSALAKKSPRWVMAAELIETNRMWARVMARIDPAWAERLGAHLVQRSYGDPRWDRKQGAAVTDERVTLFGLPLVTARSLDYGRVDPVHARDLFIRNALVQGDWEVVHPALQHNAEMIEDVLALEVRARRPLFVGDEAMVAFYASRVAESVVSARTFERWSRRISRDRGEGLEATFDQLIDPTAAVAGPDDFPDTWLQGTLELELSYVFDPGSSDDGVNVDVPLVLINQVTSDGFDWLVPGLRYELVTALLRSLPKQLRRDLGPVPELACDFLRESSSSRGPLLVQLQTYFGVPAPDWRVDILPPHLRMTFRVLGEDAAPVATGEDLDALRRRVDDLARAAVARATGWTDQTGQQTWTFGPIPKRVDAQWKGQPVRGYPSLIDEGQTVGTAIWASEADQRREMWAGTSRLLSLAVPISAKEARRQLTNEAKLAVGRGGYQSVDELLEDCATATIDRALVLRGGPVWDPVAFDSLVADIRRETASIAAAVVRFAGGILAATDRIEGRLDRMTAPAVAAAVADIREQLDGLVYPRFVQMTGAARLPDVLRYLRAVDRRLDKLPEDPGRDRERMGRIRRLADEYRSAAATPSVPSSDRDAVRWMLEELRVSEFAQVLGTPHPISEQRLRRAINRLAG
jgi:ATP-dependent helicase HrpA